MKASLACKEAALFLTFRQDAVPSPAPQRAERGACKINPTDDHCNGPPPMNMSLDRAFEVFAECIVRATVLQLGLGTSSAAKILRQTDELLSSGPGPTTDNLLP